jgi:hypothetical protein
MTFPANGYSIGDPVEARAPYDEAGIGIGETYQKSVHNSPSFDPGKTGYVQCESCHGPGGEHFGTGPIAEWAPQAEVCGQCHTDVYGTYSATAHNNADQEPGPFFDQPGLGTEQATTDQVPGYTGTFNLAKANGSPVTRNERIEECSTCHNYATERRPSHLASGDYYNAQVSCAACHDAHSPALKNLPQVSTRTSVEPSQALRFKPVRVVNDEANPLFGALDMVAGTWIRPTLYFTYNAAGLTNDQGYTDQATVQGDLMRTSSERLCAACHTRGQWKYTAQATGSAGTVAYTSTHNQDIFRQYQNSGHADPQQAAFEEFSLLAPVGGSHRPQFPIDMGRKDGRMNGGANNYTCYQCHNGIASIDYQRGVQGGLDFGDSDEAHILYGDATVTCLTCHDPHSVGAGKHVRQPKYMSYNSWFNDTNNPGAGNPRGGLNKMMDGTDIPANVGTSQICLFCHQGRESGYTLYRFQKSKGVDYYVNPAGTFTGNNSNAHYYSGGGNLWSKNSFEFTFDGVPQTYSNGIPQHQQKNCTGCHMAPANADSTAGGHTWVPQIETCHECHAGIPNFTTVAAPHDVDGDPATVTVYQSLGTIADPTGNPTGTEPGLFNILRYALYQQGIKYNPNTYPYFSKVGGGAITWTAATSAAAFNLGQLYKQGNAVYVHNYYYASQILIDSLRALGVTTNPYTGNPFERPTTPPGGTTRQATDYRTITIP